MPKKTDICWQCRNGHFMKCMAILFPKTITCKCPQCNKMGSKW